MSKNKTLTTSKLIHSIKLRAALPETLNTFTEDDFLYFINEEMDMGVIPHVTSYHEDYFLHTEEVPLVDGEMFYDIPYRAIGNKLRDITYSVGNQLSEMTRIAVEDQVDRINQFSGNYYCREFYIKGTEMVIPKSLAVSSAKLLVSYYLRPNTLVSEDSASVVTSINRNNGLVAVNQFPSSFLNALQYDITSSKPAFKLIGLEITPDGVATETNLNFTFGTIRKSNITFPTLASIIGSSYLSILDNSQGNNQLDVYWFNKTGVDPAPVVSGATLYEVNISAAVTTNNVIIALSNVLNSAYADNRLILTQTSTTTFNVQNGGVGISVGNNFSISSSGFSIVEVVASEGTITIPKKLNVNDIIALPEETTIPQIPIELHAMLAQRAAMRCLESLGDGVGLQLAAAKLADMEAKTGMLIDNRVESSPMKIKPRHTPIRRSAQGNRR